jgi:hypothetical protein
MDISAFVPLQDLGFGRRAARLEQGFEPASDIGPVKRAYRHQLQDRRQTGTYPQTVSWVVPPAMDIEKRKTVP